LISSSKLVKVTSASSAVIIKRVLLYLVIISILVVVAGFLLKFYEISKNKDVSSVVHTEAQTTRSQIHDLQATLEKHFDKLASPEEANRELQADLARQLQQSQSRYARASASYKAGYALLASGSTAEALEKFNSALTEVPDFFRAQIAVAKCLSDLGNKPFAKKRYEEALETATSRKEAKWETEALIRLGGFLLNNDDIEQGAVYLTKGRQAASKQHYNELEALSVLAVRPPDGKLREQLFWLVDLTYAAKKSEDQSTVALADFMEEALSSMVDALENWGTVAPDWRLERYIDALRLVLQDTRQSPDEALETESIPYGFLAILLACLDLREQTPEVFITNREIALARLELKFYESQNQLDSRRDRVSKLRKFAGKECVKYTLSDQKQRERYSQRIAQYNQLIQDNPNRADAYFHRGSVFLTLGQDESALQDLSRAIALEPEHREARLYRAITWAIKGDMNDALGDYMSLLTSSPLWVQHVNQARIYLNRPQCTKEDLQQATAELYEALKLKDDCVDAMSMLAEIEGANGQLDSAIGLAQQASALRPDLDSTQLGTLYKQRASQRYRLGDLRSALDDLALAVKANTNLATTTVQLRDGRDLQVLYRYDPPQGLPGDDAAKWSQAEQDQNPLLRAYISLLLGDLNEALSEYDRATQLRPRDADLHMNRAALLTASGDQKKAVDSYNQVIFLQPTNLHYSSAFFERALLREQMGDYQGAVSDYSGFLKTQSETSQASNALLKRGNIFHNRGEYDLALDDYSNILKFHPNTEEVPWALLNRARILASRGKVQAAVADYKETIKDSPLHVSYTTVEAYRALGELLYPTNDAARALACYDMFFLLTDEAKDKGLDLGFDAASQADASLHRGLIRQERPDL
jgi:tetratricopeptide (TPR) repeat protein